MSLHILIYLNIYRFFVFTTTHKTSPEQLVGTVVEIQGKALQGCSLSVCHHVRCLK